MADIASRFHANVYRRKDIKEWNLPTNIYEQIKLEAYEYFFLVSSIEKKSDDNHIHFSLYPIQENTVHLFEIQAQKIVPQLLTNALILIKEEGFNIISSTGFCTSHSNCYFGIFTSIDCEFQVEEIILRLSNLERIDNIKVYAFSCEGCCELKPPRPK
ncbi:MAG: hypothetical protein EU541_00980 [Promethearchaeota archaeon]|nr:MAG: hypothetical protein EU541_00980 [Candidatus Lokiarchaeota archaeon]